MSYIYALTDTWNSAPTTFVGIGLNVTDTASAAGSLLMDLQVGGSSKFSVLKNGTFTAQFGQISPTAINGLDLNYTRAGISLGSTAPVNWTDGQPGAGTMDLQLRRDAANTLAQRNGVNAQTFRLYNTYTDASNYERGTFGYVTNRLTIGHQNAGTGADRSIDFVGQDFSWKTTAGTPRWYMLATGHFVAAADNTYDIGAGGANRPRNIYAASGINSAGAVDAGGLAASLLPSGVQAASSATIGFSSTTASNGAQDVTLARDAANTLAQRNGTNAQTFRVYGTYTDASNYERAFIKTQAGNLQFGFEKAGTGSNRVLELVGGNGIAFNALSSGIVWQINSSGHFLAGTDNTYDIGVSGANRPRNIYAAGQTDIAGLSGSITATAVPAGGTQALRMTTTSALGVYVGSGAPTVSAAKGSLYLRTDGTTTNDRMYVNTNGSTTWTAVTTAA